MSDLELMRGKIVSLMVGLIMGLMSTIMLVQKWHVISSLLSLAHIEMEHMWIEKHCFFVIFEWKMPSLCIIRAYSRSWRRRE